MRIEVVEDAAELETRRGEWLELWRNCPGATPFQAPQWILPWIRHLFGGGRILALGMRDGDALVGLAPLFRWGTDRRRVSFLGAGISDYGDVLFAPGREAEVVAAMRRFLGETRDEWDDLDLREVRGGAALLNEWPGEFCAVCPVLDLRTFPGGMDPGHRTDVRRAGNRLRKRGETQFFAADEATLDGHLKEFFRLYEARWGELDEPLRRFHVEVARGFLESGDLRLSVLRAGGVGAAAVYGFRAGRVLYCYLSGFDPALAKLSPGAVLLGWTIEQAVREGLEAVDFLRDGETYKYLWGARDRLNYAVRGMGFGPGV